MTIANAMKEFFLKLNGTKPTGDTIADVIYNGAANVETEKKSIVLQSSTASSTKKFSITVTDDGEISATEITES